MKKRAMILLLALVMMAVLPLICFQPKIPDKKPSESSTTEKQEKKPDSSQTKNVFKILDTSSHQIIEVEDREFCIGAVAYEMPPSFETEALKAQCVACYTHFSRLRENPDSNLNGADFSADLSKGELYISDKLLKEKWGNMYGESRQKIESAVDDVFGQTLTDNDGHLIQVAYHAISSGQTESSKEIFGFDSPYLQPVSSAGDVNVSGYLSSKEISADRFREVMSAEKIQLEGSPDTWIGECQKTQSATVKTLQVGNQKISGEKIRELFNLRSACFDIKYNKNKFILTVYGYGHGVGMSQYGANAMASQGSSYDEILHHYYNNAQCIMHNA